MKTIKIVSNGGRVIGTKVYDESGEEIVGISGIRIAPLLPEVGIIRAELTMAASLDVDAHAILSLESIAHYAAIHGYALTKVSKA